MKRICKMVAAAAGLCGTCHAASLSLGTPFADNAVLQRGRPVPVWGAASPGAEVRLAFAGQTRTAKADAKDASGAVDLFVSFCGKPDDYGDLRTWRGRFEWAKVRPAKYDVNEIGDTVYEPRSKFSLQRVFKLMRDRFDWTEYWPDLKDRRQDARCFSTGRMATAKRGRRNL